MKTLILIFLLSLSFNTFAADYSKQYRNAPPSNAFIVLKAQKRMNWLLDAIYVIEYKIKTNTATKYEYALYNKFKEEYIYLTSQYGQPQ